MEVKEATTPKHAIVAASLFVLLVLASSLSWHSVKAAEVVPDSPEKVEPLKVGDKAPKVS